LGFDTREEFEKAVEESTEMNDLLFAAGLLKYLQTQNGLVLAIILRDIYPDQVEKKSEAVEMICKVVDDPKKREYISVSIMREIS
jgi:uncharacterized protein YbbC (DUF1343 family)